MEALRGQKQIKVSTQAKVSQNQQLPAQDILPIQVLKKNKETQPQHHINKSKNNKSRKYCPRKKV